MSICQKCGHIDRSMWRQNRWRTNVYFLKYKEYREDIDLEIVKKLEAGHPVVLDKWCAYRISGKVIERIPRADYEVGGISAFHIPREKVDHSRDLEQTRLVVGGEAEKEAQH